MNAVVKAGTEFKMRVALSADFAAKGDVSARVSYLSDYVQLLEAYSNRFGAVGVDTSEAGPYQTVVVVAGAFPEGDTPDYLVLRFRALQPCEDAGILAAMDFDGVNDTEVNAMRDIVSVEGEDGQAPVPPDPEPAKRTLNINLVFVEEE